MKSNIHPITVDLPIEAWEALSRMAKKDGRKVAWLAKKIIMDETNKHKEEGNEKE